jgi:ATP-dependent RNA helicase DDX51/DBP6
LTITLIQLYPFFQTGAKRNRVLNKFSSGKLDILVCSDALARGIDIGQIDFVICYDCPGYVKTYIHRVGRTARAGRTGSAITLAEAKEEKKFRAMLKEAGKESTVAAIEVDEEALDKEQYEAAAKRAGEAIAAETAIEREKKRAGWMKNRKKKN